MIGVYGACFSAKITPTYRSSFDHQHAHDEVLFVTKNAGDSAADYTLWGKRRLVPYVDLFFDLSSYGAHKELALVFGFYVYQKSRILIYSDAGQLGDETLVVGDDQFLIVVESVETPLELYFIHANLPGDWCGGVWYFQGITGYVI
jgi:hypothetical protein